MSYSNDNYSSESVFLLNKAREMLEDCNNYYHSRCRLQDGGSCPLIRSAMASLKVATK